MPMPWLRAGGRLRLGEGIACPESRGLQGGESGSDAAARLPAAARPSRGWRHVRRARLATRMLTITRPTTFPQVSRARGTNPGGNNRNLLIPLGKALQ